MDWNIVILAVAIMTGAGLLMGGLLAVASIRFHVEVDPKVGKARAVLPGSNCGACGFPGCDAAAEAIVKGDAPVNVCVAGGREVEKALAETLGIDAGDEKEPVVTVVRCRGGRGNVKTRYKYDGIASCHAANLTAGGPLACSWGCLGYGDCVKACPFDAVKMGEDGLPEIDLVQCTRCGICVSACPRNIIAFLPASSEVAVLCVSRDKGKVVRAACKVGCIACRACERICEPGAITITDNLAIIDYAKCTGCGKCVDKCPTKCLVWRAKVPEVQIEAVI